MVDKALLRSPCSFGDSLNSPRFGLLSHSCRTAPLDFGKVFLELPELLLVVLELLAKLDQLGGGLLVLESAPHLVHRGVDLVERSVALDERLRDERQLLADLGAERKPDGGDFLDFHYCPMSEWVVLTMPRPETDCTRIVADTRVIPAAPTGHRLAGDLVLMRWVRKAISIIDIYCDRGTV